MVLRFVVDDGRNNIDVVGFYDDHAEFESVYRNLRVNDWYLFKNFKKVIPSQRGRYRRGTDHKYELITKSGTQIVSTTAT